MMLKKTIPIIVILTLIITASLPATHSRANGIPVHDVANLMQTMKSYISQIKRYQELLKLNYSSTAQLITVLRQYRLKIQEFRRFLNQIKGIKHLIAQEDWLRLMKLGHHYIGKSQLSTTVQDNDPNESDYENKLNKTLEAYGYVPRDPRDAEADAHSLGIWSEQYQQAAREDYNAFESYKDRLRAVSKNRQEDDKVRKELERHYITLDSLGDESDLATQQAIAAQNLTMMKQLRTINNTMNSIMLNMENEQAHKAAMRARERDRELKRLRNLKPTPGLGRDRMVPK